MKTQMRRHKSSASELRDNHGRLHWLGADGSPPSELSKVVLFFHGGGYAVPLSRAHLDWCSQHIHEARKNGRSLCVAILQYDLCPAARYPRQLQQAAAALEQILERGFSPANIVLGGDSAGGNLTFALLGHLLHPHPQVASVKIRNPLGGAFGISPWVTMSLRSTSFDRNASIDMLSAPLVQQSGHDFLNATSSVQEIRSGHAWSLPLESGLDWWKGLHRCVQRVFLNAGQQEMFHDHVIQFAQLLSRSNKAELDLTLDIGKEEAHDHVLTEFMMGCQRGRAFQALDKWMNGGWDASQSQSSESPRL